MRILIILIYYIGLLFFGVGILYPVCCYILLDGMGTTGLVLEAEKADVNIKKDSSYYYIDYTYTVEEKVFSDKATITIEKYKEYNPDTLIIKYNKHFPSINFIEQAPIKLRSYKLDAVIGFIGFLYIFLVWNLSDREKWFRKYGF